MKYTAAKSKLLFRFLSRVARAGVLIAILLAAGVRAADDEADAPKDTLPVRGVVVDGDDRPAVNVNMQPFHWLKEGDGAVTDADGRFVLPIPRDWLRDLTLLASTPDGKHQALYHHAAKPADNVPIDNIELRLKLAPALEYTVNVTDVAGAPIEGARVGLTATHHSFPIALTDASGTVTLRGPLDEKVTALFAFKPGAGLDYRSYENDRQPSQPPPVPPKSGETIALVLAGAETVKVRLLDQEGRPVPDMPLHPWLLEKPDQPEELNLSYFRSVIEAVTDQEGVATFDWIPTWSTGKLQFWPVGSEEFARRRVMYDPAQDQGQVTAKVDRVVPVSGHIRFADGRPAPGIHVSGHGAGKGVDSFDGQTTTDDDGRFEFQAWPEELFMIVVTEQQWGAAPLDGFVIRRGKSIDNLEMTLRPATRVHGRVTLGTDDRPLHDQQVLLNQLGRDLNKVGQNVEAQEPDSENRYVSSRYSRFATTDDDGRYAFFVGPGKYVINGSTQAEAQEFEIRDESERIFDFVATRPERGDLAGLVVVGNPPQPVRNAKVTGIYRTGHGDFTVTTDDDGRFSLARSLHPLVVFASSDDGSLVGIADVTSDERSVTIAVNPLATATGRLVDARTKKPLPHRDIQYGARVYMGDASERMSWRTSGGGSAQTDDEGRFTLNHIIVGRTVEVDVLIDPKGHSSRNVAEVRVRSAAPIDLGDVAFGQDRRTTPTLQERVIKDFAAVTTPLAEYSAALAAADESHRHVLLVFGDPVAGATQSLFEAFYNAEGKVAAAAVDFHVIPVDVVSTKSTQGPKVARGRGVDLAEYALPIIYICDGDGKRLAVADRVELMPQGIVDDELLAGFLHKHAPPQASGQ